MAASASSSTQPADTVHATANSADAAPVVIAEKRLKRYKIALDLPLRHFFSKQGFAPGAVSYRVRAIWKEVLDGSFHENNITQSLMHTVRKDPAVSKLVKEEIFHILATSDSESEDEKECKMAASSSYEPRTAKKAQVTECCFLTLTRVHARANAAFLQSSVRGLLTLAEDAQQWRRLFKSGV